MPPAYVLAPVITSVPVPVTVNPPGPEKTPDNSAEPLTGVTIVPPALRIVNGWLEVSPADNVSAPPSNTGLVVTPILLSPTVLPAARLVIGTGVGVGVGEGVGVGAELENTKFHQPAFRLSATRL